MRVAYELDPARLRKASYLLVTLHKPDDERQLLASSPEPIRAPQGVVEVPLPPGVTGDVVVRASAYNTLRQRSDPLETQTGDQPGG